MTTETLHLGRILSPGELDYRARVDLTAADMIRYSLGDDPDFDKAIKTAQATEVSSFELPHKELAKKFLATDDPLKVIDYAVRIGGRENASDFLGRAKGRLDNTWKNGRGDYLAALAGIDPRSAQVAIGAAVRASDLLDSSLEKYDQIRHEIRLKEGNAFGS